MVTKKSKAKVKKPAKKAAPKKVKKAKKIKKAVKAKKPVKAKVGTKASKKPVGKKKVPVKKKPAVKTAAKKPAKKIAAARTAKPASQAGEDRPVGRITHYFDQIEVGVIELTEDLVVGEVIRIVGGEDTDFKQIVESMELDHEKIEKAKKGKEVGLQLKKKAREGYKVYRVKG